MLPLEHSAILLTCIKPLSVLKINFCVLFEWPLKTGLIVLDHCINDNLICCHELHAKFIRRFCVKRRARAPGHSVCLKSLFYALLHSQQFFSHVRTISCLLGSVLLKDTTQ